MPPAESSLDGYPLDERQQRRILDGVLAGPIMELLGEVVRRLPNPPRRVADEAAYQLAVERRLRPMEVDIALTDESGRAGYGWPGNALTGDDRRRLATMGNTTQLSTTRLLHHSVQVAHHLFQSIMLEIMATSQRTGVAVRDLLTNATSDNGHPARNGIPQPQADLISQLDADHPGVELPCAHEPGTIGDPAEAQANDRSPIATDEDDDICTTLSIPPQPMVKRTPTTPSRESVTEERVEELEDRIDRLQETMQVLIDAIDGLRVDLVHTLRNLPDRLPAPLQIHSLPLDPTDSDFAERVNAIPLEVMARLREEAVRGRAGEPSPAAAAEGDPSPASVIEETSASDRRRGARQPKLFP